MDPNNTVIKRLWCINPGPPESGYAPPLQGLFWPQIFMREKIPFGQKQ